MGKRAILLAILVLAILTPGCVVERVARPVPPLGKITDVVGVVVIQLWANGKITNADLGALAEGARAVRVQMAMADGQTAWNALVQVLSTQPIGAKAAFDAVVFMAACHVSAYPGRVAEIVDAVCDGIETGVEACRGVGGV